MKKYQVYTKWHMSYERHGFQNAPRRRMEGSVEEIETRIRNMGDNIHYRIKDLETKEVVAEGNTNLNPSAYGFQYAN